MLDHAGIEALIPHRGSMCLLDRLVSHDAVSICCQATSHTSIDNPLRTRSGLLSAVLVEYAAQAMALHGALLARAAARTASPGFLASARGVSLQRLRIDDLPEPLDIEARRQAGDDRQLLYAFRITHAGEAIAEGRVAVVLNAALSLPG